ncbi:hypothetical protein GXW74_15610 [Roseomonas eburnea]|uniref:Uncharacterized protein n=1 Tax=Neoroseomonas eburnea TaxID=1346889 RepID=A0A9X9XDY5_9PROT|nr:hypothetical protein [Neoroseomonas eburnea]MBR0681921.1 hypothetical protein [Neoroseomonas eburnea]
MSDTREAEAEAIRRRYAVVFREPLESLRNQPVEMLRRLLAKADAQRELYLSLGFEVDDPETEAAPRE